MWGTCKSQFLAVTAAANVLIEEILNHITFNHLDYDTAFEIETTV